MKIRYDDDPDYAKGRLQKTVVVNKDKTRLLFIDTIVTTKNGLDVLVIDVETKKQEVVRIFDLCLENPPVGMTLYYNSIVYLMRFPHRQYRQGLSWESLSAYYVDGKSCNVDRSNTFNGLSFLYNPCLDIYPDITTALEMFDNDYKIVPLNRDVALNKKGDIYFRNYVKPVGKCDFTRNKITLDDDKKFLRANHTISSLYPGVTSV